MSETTSPWGPATGEPRLPASLDLPLYGATFGQSVSRFFRGYVRFSGRASRSEYWWAELFQAIVGTVFGAILSVVVMVLMFALIASTDSGSSDSAAAVTAKATVWGLIVMLGGVLVLSLPLLLPRIALSVRRLHDTNRSGLWCLLMLVPYGSWVVVVLCALETDPAGARFDRAESAAPPATL